MVLPNLSLAAVLLGLGLQATAAKYELDEPSQILSAARTLASDGMAAYEGNREGHTPGRITEEDPTDGGYAWWQGGVFLTAFVDYFARTGDATHNKVVGEGLLRQAGEGFNYRPRVDYLGNGAQCSWAMGAVLAANSGFPKATGDQPDWIKIAQNVFDEQAVRFDYEEKKLEYDTCGGGLRSSIDASGNYYYKDSFSNACFMNLGARLAKSTGNDTYARYAERTWDWLWKVFLINHENYALLYGTSTTRNCTAVLSTAETGPAGHLIEAAATMFNISKTPDVWKERTQKLLDKTLSSFFPKDVAIEPFCEESPIGRQCSPDVIPYKGILHRSLSAVVQLAPFTAEKARPVLLKSARAAVALCTGEKSGKKCGFGWSSGKYVEPYNGAMEQANVLVAVAGLLEARPATGAGGSGSESADKSGEKSSGPDLRARGSLSLGVSSLMLACLMAGLSVVF